MLGRAWVLVILGCLPQVSWGLDLNDSRYRIETVVTYDHSTIGRPIDFTFGPSEEIYVTHTFGDTLRNGTVLKVNPDLSMVPLRNDLVDPRKIVYGGGTSFGSQLYVTDQQAPAASGTGEITKLGLDGSKTTFSTGLNQPSALAIDSTGRYGDHLYSAQSAHDHIRRVGSGGGLSTAFSSYPGTFSGSVGDIAFDSTGAYGHSMFTTAIFQSNPSVSGLFTIDPSGNAVRFVEGIDHARSLAIDESGQNHFGGKMFAVGYSTADQEVSLYRVNGQDDFDVFATGFTTPTWASSSIAFGNDGSLYVMQERFWREITVIQRISLIPEPTSLVLLALGGLVMQRQLCRRAT